ncbi:MAG: SUMF1/EgtB/PvdO family nonheme iron enzyme [Acidobacteria bacterium]|nr:SUMF1/EgtB/PvdO family nonheme iron enzyme [Acidobacteriota bacterium]
MVTTNKKLLLSFAICLLISLISLSLETFAQKSSSSNSNKQTTERGLGLPTVAQWPTSAKRYALVIGVEQYQDKQITPLTAAANDAKLLADALVKYAGFPAEQVVLLASDQPTERQPTRENILRRLSNLRAAIPSDGLLLVSFAGHGIEREGRAFLLPSNAQVSGDISLLEDTAVSVDTIKERIRQTGVKQVVMVLDACRNDPTAGRADAPNNLTEAYTRGFNFDVRNKEVSAFATLYATSVGSRAYENTEKKNGYFTLAIVDGLKGGAANSKGEVTLDALKQYVQDEVPKRVKIDLGVGKKQDPQIVLDGYKANELVISITVSVKTAENNSINSSSNSNSSSPSGALSSATTVGAGGLPLRAYEFKTVDINATGKVLKEETKQAKSYLEKLGDVNLEMVEIPAGSFLMGSEQTEKGYGYTYDSEELPQHKVSVKGFYLGKFEVTQAQWRFIANLPKINIDLKPKVSWFRDDSNPVEQITWEEAVEFCARLSKHTGKEYRLPTEAEWEYAARAGTDSAFGFGDEITLKQVNYKGYFNYRYQGPSPEGFLNATFIVGSSNVANSFGLYDMHGNVWEYCQDVWHENYEGAPTDGSAWLTGADEKKRTARGGGWLNAGFACRSAFRTHVDLTTWKHNAYGFRVAMTVPKNN